MDGVEKRAREHVKKVVETYEAIAEGFSSTRRSPWTDVLRLLSDVSGKSVLDVGCGNGRHTVELARRTPLVVGIDLSKRLVKMAEGRVRKSGLAHRAMLVVGDALFLPFRRASFDIVTCIAVLHHIPTEGLRRRAVSEMVRALRSGGLCMITTWYRWQRRLLLALVKGMFMRLTRSTFEFGDVYVPWRSRGKVYKRFYHLFTLGELRNLLSAEGLEIKELRLMTIGRRKWMNVVATAIKR
jgi:ubiquinone/menaquinone biosynthesis C-methylase UbiE